MTEYHTYYYRGLSILLEEISPTSNYANYSDCDDLDYDGECDITRETQTASMLNIGLRIYNNPGALLVGYYQGTFGGALIRSEYYGFPDEFAPVYSLEFGLKFDLIQYSLFAQIDWMYVDTNDHGSRSYYPLKFGVGF